MTHVAYWSYDYTEDGLQPDGTYRYPSLGASTAWSTAPGNTSTTQSIYGDLKTAAFGGAAADEMVFQDLFPIPGAKSGFIYVEGDEDLASVVRLQRNFAFDGIGNPGPDGPPEDYASVNFSEDALITGKDSYAYFRSLNLNSDHVLNVRLDGGLHFNDSIINVGTLNFLNSGSPQFSMQNATLNGDIYFATEMLTDITKSTIIGDISIGQRAYINDTNINGTVSLRSDALIPYDRYKEPHIFISLRTTNILSTDTAIEGNTKDNTTEIIEGSVTGDVSMGAGADVLILNRSDFNGDMDMGHGNDYLFMNRATANGSIKMAAGDDSLMLWNMAFEGDIHMGRGDDNLEFIATSQETVTIRLGAGNDALRHSYADARVFGGDGDDTLNVGGGRNWLRGDAGADTFVINVTSNGVDREDLTTIRDFSRAEGDKIQLANAGSQFVGGTFTGTAGDVIQVGAQLRVDIDGDTTTDVIVIVRGDALVADDFIF